jgi:hypothetical protein
VNCRQIARRQQASAEKAGRFSDGITADFGDGRWLIPRRDFYVNRRGALVIPASREIPEGAFMRVCYPYRSGARAGRG